MGIVCAVAFAIIISFSATARYAIHYLACSLTGAFDESAGDGRGGGRESKEGSNSWMMMFTLSRKHKHGHVPPADVEWNHFTETLIRENVELLGTSNALRNEFVPTRGFLPFRSSYENRSISACENRTRIDFSIRKWHHRKLYFFTHTIQAKYLYFPWHKKLSEKIKREGKKPQTFNEITEKNACEWRKEVLSQFTKSMNLPPN